MRIDFAEETMADSDDEYERRRRDKFRGERSEYTSSSSTRDRRDDSRRGRDDWADRWEDNMLIVIRLYSYVNYVRVCKSCGTLKIYCINVEKFLLYYAF